MTRAPATVVPPIDPAGFRRMSYHFAPVFMAEAESEASAAMMVRQLDGACAIVNDPSAADCASGQPPIAIVAFATGLPSASTTCPRTATPRLRGRSGREL